MDEKDNIFPDNNTESLPDEQSGTETETPDAETQPKYDAFMFEPIGFEELERQQAEQAAAEQLEKKRRLRSDRIIVTFLIVIFICTIGLCCFAIVSGRNGGSNPFGFGNSSKNKVILYREDKPYNPADDENYKDENGKYSTIGVAAVVRPSIVEIYTYSDSAHSTLLGTGSGIILSDDGYILTNAHVLQSDGYHVVITSDDRQFDAKIVGRDTKTDIAIIKISASKLQPAVLGNSDDVVVGEQVMAIGNPAGLSGSVTDGIVSAVGRRIKSDSTGFEMNCIQTNADISPGNSGGALVNMYGQVIGITSSKYVSSLYEGLGFAITINDAMPIMEELMNQGYVSDRFRIGIQLIDMSTDLKRDAIEEELGFELPEDFKGIYIAEISDDCDIASTELQPGDFITAINGKNVSTYDELYDTISQQYGAGDYVPAACARVDKDGNIDCFDIEFMLMEDTSGDY
ncbi:MAG: S1C family serine protease [Ruminococcus sp.]|nr:trypsin-like peptidase domain-containing protein [Oscillospiraceae bacterium]